MLRPLRDQILVLPEKREASSIILTVLDEKPNIGKIVAAGPGLIDSKGRKQQMDVKVGDTIRFGEFAFPKYYDMSTQTEYLIMRQPDVAGIVYEDQTDKPAQAIAV